MASPDFLKAQISDPKTCQCGQEPRQVLSYNGHEIICESCKRFVFHISPFQAVRDWNSNSNMMVKQ